MRPARMPMSLSKVSLAVATTRIADDQVEEGRGHGRSLRCANTVQQNTRQIANIVVDNVPGEPILVQVNFHEL